MLGQVNKTNMIMPATARGRLEPLYFGLVAGELRKLSNTFMVPRADAIKRVCDFIISDFVKYSPKNYQNNKPVYDKVLRDEVTKEASQFDWPFEAQEIDDSLDCASYRTQ